MKIPLCQNLPGWLCKVLEEWSRNVLLSIFFTSVSANGRARLIRGNIHVELLFELFTVCDLLEQREQRRRNICWRWESLSSRSWSLICWIRFSTAERVTAEICTPQGVKLDLESIFSAGVSSSPAWSASPLYLFKSHFHQQPACEQGFPADSLCCMFSHRLKQKQVQTDLHPDVRHEDQSEGGSNRLRQLDCVLWTDRWREAPQKNFIHTENVLWSLNYCRSVTESGWTEIFVLLEIFSPKDVGLKSERAANIHTEPERLESWTRSVHGMFIYRLLSVKTQPQVD